MSATRVELMRDERTGLLPTFTSIGAYPVLYLTAGNLVLCADCANKPADEVDDPAVVGDVYWEGPPEVCEDCGGSIESAYGDPDAGVES